MDLQITKRGSNKRDSRVVYENIYVRASPDFSTQQRVIFTGITNNSAFGDTRIYINDHLPQDSNKLLGAVKAKQHKLGIKYVWTQTGNIFMRRDDNSPAIIIIKHTDIK